MMKQKRYFITDTLDDFIGASKREEELFIANLLADLLHEYVLRVNGKWLGSSKWFIRVLRKYDEQYADQFVAAFDHFIQRRERKLNYFCRTNARTVWRKNVRRVFYRKIKRG